ncbi:MAG: aminoglycoside phosphotransferase [Gammaproteobacteria bacterium]|nr:phosphotransferase [Pseudomonadota bacterium]TDJ32770.1 MAG: aminoglycoside phosphotransferase [Gammaproteobacteria bacterium]
MDLVADNRDAISEHLLALGWISAAEKIEDIASAGEGNMNRTLRVTLNSRSIVLKQSLSCVAKYPHIAAPIERIGIEAEFYQAIADQTKLSRHTPKVLGFDPTSHLLCLEDLGPSSDFTDLYDLHASNHDIAELKDELTSLVSWLSELHALPNLNEHLPQGLDNHAMRELNHTHIFEIPLTPDNGLTLDNGLNSVAEEFAGDEELRERATQLGQIYLGRASHDSAKVLLHGDFYPGSWLKHPSMGIKVIDPEFAFLGPPEFDVGVLLAHFTMCGFEPSELTKLLDNYTTSKGFSDLLVKAFSGIEMIRRLLGVAQLPLCATVETKVAWLQSARVMVLG